MSVVRVGHGFDAHRLVSGRSLRLGGVELVHPRGLAGHSDGDCVLHAVCDALLGAAGEGDMGRHFPSSDARWKGADSRLFVEEVSRILAARGFRLGNLDVTVLAQEPALAPHLEAMRNAIARALGVAPACISVKAKSTDGLGALGRAEGIAAIATALVAREDGAGP